ncbi:MAG: DNA polymerase I [Bacteroidales bacterium]|nr:DNA polymerase I [Bacteroidales bacterium]
MKPPPTLFLLDAMALIYRAFYALNKNPRVNAKGLNTSAILGFTNSLWSVITTENPTHIAVASDSQAPTVRHLDYEQYKANRQAMPDEIAASLPWIDRILEAMRIPKLMMDGYEADDIIGTLSKEAEKKGFTVYMMSSDKDLGQLITDNILMYRPGKMGDVAEVFGKKEICEKFGVGEPRQIIDLLGLWGDASDNIPGIPGVGEKTARDLLRQFPTVEELVARADEIKNPRLQEKVKQFADQALFSKQLATIITDVPVPFDEEQLRMKSPDEQALKAVLEELEFRQLAKRIFTDLSLKKSPEERQSFEKQPAEGQLFGKQPAEGQMDLFGHYEVPAVPQPDLFSQTSSSFKNIKDGAPKYHLITDKNEAEKLAEKLATCPEVCFDTETTGLDALTSELVGISFAVDVGEAWFVAFPENKKEAMEMAAVFKKVLENETIMKIGQNIKFDISILKGYDVHARGAMFDTMIAHYLLQPDTRHNMNLLAEQYLGYSPVPIEDLIGKQGKNQLSMRVAFRQNPERVKEYACEDTDVTIQLKNIFLPLLEKAGFMPLFSDIEMPLVNVLASMETDGVHIDEIALNQFSTKLSDEILQFESDIYNLAGKSFNIASPKQLGDVLFKDLKISSNVKKTKTGQYATGEDILIKLQHSHPIVEKILDYRSLSKLKSTYADALPELINPHDGRVHTSYNQTVTATGRLSSTNPNLQNIPVRTELGREIRKAFIPRNDDFTLLAADYSQIELRIIAHISGDAAMKEDFINGIDIHTATASRVFNVALDQVSREQRRMAKVVNFGIIYGISAFGLSERLGIGRKEAGGIIEQYLEKYSGIRTYMENQIAFARQHGYVETLMGRRRYLPDIEARNMNMRSFAERNAINAPIQGSAADLIKIAMIRIWDEFQKQQLTGKMVLQVHDELVFDIPKSEEETVTNIVRQKMETALSLSVPLVVDISGGNNWLEAH